MPVIDAMKSNTKKKRLIQQLKQFKKKIYLNQISLKKNCINIYVFVLASTKVQTSKFKYF